MKILIVNGYQLDSKLSQKNYQYFLKTIKEAFEGNEVIDNFYIEREINELEDAASEVKVEFDGAGFKRSNQKFVGYGLESWSME